MKKAPYHISMRMLKTHCAKIRMIPEVVYIMCQRSDPRMLTQTIGSLNLSVNHVKNITKYILCYSHVNFVKQILHDEKCIDPGFRDYALYTAVQAGNRDVALYLVNKVNNVTLLTPLQILNLIESQVQLASDCHQYVHGSGLYVYMESDVLVPYFECDAQLEGFDILLDFYMIERHGFYVYMSSCGYTCQNLDQAVTEYRIQHCIFKRPIHS